MWAIEKIVSSGVGSQSWVQICRLYPNEWVCLLDIDREPGGSIRSAHVVSHDRSIERALDQIDPPNPDVTVVHTSGHPLWTPRIEIVVADLGYGVDGLLGINFLRHFNLEIRYAERRLLVERI